jgi:hypothetical protein
MKAIKIIFGLLAGVYAVAQVIQLIGLLAAGAYISAVMGSMAGVCIGGAISVTLIKSAFSSPCKTLDE